MNASLTAAIPTRTRTMPLVMGQIEQPVHPLRFPADDFKDNQDQEWCEVYVGGHWKRLRLHDYSDIYGIPGLYEQLFCQTLECTSAWRVPALLGEVLREWPANPTDLRVLDVGAGNGMVGQQLRQMGVQSLVGVDIIPEAASAAHRDRPSLYDDYLVADLCDLTEEDRSRLESFDFNCMSVVAALGFGDMPLTAFATAYNLLESPGWLAFNIRDRFMQESDSSGFCALIRRMSEMEVIQIQAYRRYCHRKTVNGRRLYYMAMVARKLRDIPQDLLDEVA